MEDEVSKSFLIRTLIGCMLVCLSNGVLYYWGNMAVYVSSYMRMRDIIDSSVESPWLLSAYVISYSVSMIVAGTIAKTIGRRSTMVLGIVIIDGGLLCSFFTVQRSIHGFNVTQGAMQGIGEGLIYSMVLQYVVECTDKNVGLIMTIASTASIIGGAIVTQIDSLYVNPDNKIPNLELGSSTYFTYVDVLDNVPSMFLVVSVFTITTHIIGMILLREKPKPSINYTSIESDTSDEETPSSNIFKLKSFFSKSKYGNETEILIPIGNDVTNQMSDLALEKKDEYILENMDSDIEGNGEDENEDDLEKSDATVYSYTPREILQNKLFYVIWTIMFINEMAYVAYANYYKTFGELFIKNDHSLSRLGAAVWIIVAVSKPVWGLMTDKLNVKHVIISLTSVISLSFMFYYFTPMVSNWFFYLWSIVIGCIVSGLYAVITVCTYKLFGPKYVSTNFGLVMSANILLNIGAPPFFRLVLEKWGWFWLFFIIGFLNCFGTFLVSLTLPDI